jgi:hypothetical protein
LITVVAMWPALSDISNTIMGSIQPSDATAGGVWLSWQFASLSPFTAHTLAYGVPRGEPLWLPTFITALGWILPMWALAHITNAVATWNILIALGLVADGMAMYGLVRWLTGRGWIAFVAGVLYAYSPFHIQESYVHIGYLYSWIFPLVLWAGLAMLKSPGRRQAVVFGTVVAAAAYIDGYYVVFAPMVATVVVACGVAGAGLLQVPRRQVMEGSVLAAAVAVILVLPIGYVYLFSSQTVGSLLSQTKRVYALDISSAHLSGYLVPWMGSPAWSRLASGVSGAAPDFVRGDGSLYLGLVVVVLATCLAVMGLARSRWVTLPAFRLPGPFLALAVPAAMLIVMLSSFATIGRVPGFPTMLWAIKPFWPDFDRLDVAVDCLVILAAAVFLACIQGERRKWLLPAIAVLALADGTAVFPWASWSFAANTPASLRWLASHKDGGTVAGYQMEPFAGRDALYLTFQAINHHPLFNGETMNPGHTELARGLAALGDPQTIPTLRREGVRYIVLTRLYDHLDWKRDPVRGVRLIFAIRGGSTLLRIEPGPRPPAALTIIRGFSDRQNVLRVAHWMLKRWALMGLDVFQRHVLLQISFDVRSYRLPRQGRLLQVFQGRPLRWRGHVSSSFRLVRFDTSSDGNLRLEAKPGAVSIPGIRYPRAIQVSDLDVQIASRSD